VRGTVRPDSPAGTRTEPVGTDARTSPPERPGVDFGSLLGLVGECGGHVWMAAEPNGNMVLKIHLPARLSSAVADPPVPVPQADRGRGMARWFRH
jgi:hypothetical protein